MNEPRAKCLSISSRNRSSNDTIEDYSMQWDLDYSNTLFKIVDCYDRLIKWLKGHKWAVMQEYIEE